MNNQFFLRFGGILSLFYRDILDFCQVIWGNLEYSLLSILAPWKSGVSKDVVQTHTKF